MRRQALARRLVGAGLVSDDALTAAADDVRAGAPSLVRALLDRADVAPEEVTRLAADQATDAVCELLRWSSGAFSFLVGEEDPEGLQLGLAADELVAEGERRSQVWPSLTSHIPSPETVLRLAAAPAFDPSCSREEWGLLALVDGKRSVSEIVALLGRSEFAVAGALAALVERGLLTVSAAGSGLADLQRRQDVIAALEANEPKRSAPAMQPEPIMQAPMVAPAEAPASEVPLARTEVASAFEDLLAGPAEPGPVTSHARSYDQLPTQGSAALDPAHDIPPGTGARGLDSAVTKSLVLRLIAGVRGL